MIDLSFRLDENALQARVDCLDARVEFGHGGFELVSGEVIDEVDGNGGDDELGAHVQCRDFIN